jgi:DNA-binding transcriptional ArsR family regulator
MPRPEEHLPVGRPLETGEAERLAERMAAFATASRLKLLYGLLDGPATVEQLAQHSGLSPNTVSQQLRMLRHLRLVAVTREGRHAHYRLHDDHLVDLLGAIRHQLDHAEHDWIDPTPATQAHPDAAAR